MSNYQIIYQDSDILVINKPAGAVVNDAQTYHGQTVQQWFKQYWQEEAKESAWQDLVPANFDAGYGSPQEIGQHRQGLVHRLDKDTSGVLLLAKNPGSLVNLLAQFKQREVKKTYQCLVHGQLAVPRGVVEAPIARASGDRKRFAIVASGRTATTQYTVEQIFSGEKLIENLLKSRVANNELDKQEKKLLEAKNLRMYQAGFSLVSCWPKTGRTHQIRVHLKHLGHALVGDQTYTGKKRVKTDKLWCPRQFLHAAQIEFKHPRSGEVMKLKADLTQDLRSTLALLI